MDLETFLQMADEYKALGWSVQGQLAEIADGSPMEDQNPNALKIIKSFLLSLDMCGIKGADDLAEEIDDYLAELGDI